MRIWQQRDIGWIVLSSTLVLLGAAEQASAQNAQRGYSTRGMNRVGTQRAGMTPRYTRPLNNRSVLPYGGNANAGGPLSLDYSPLMAAPPVFFNPGMFGLGVEGALSADMSMQSGTTGAGFRPSIRPRLDLTDRDAMTSKGVLGKIRDTVLQQIARCGEKPFSPEWYAAHGDVKPLNAAEGNVWQGQSWTQVQQWLGAEVAPQPYDFRPDRRGLIFVYRDGVQQGRAVDGRAAALALAQSAVPADESAPGLSLGVFAAVPPVDVPVSSLVHLVLSKSGAVAGYQYDFPTDSMRPVRGAFEPDSQRTAWQAGNVVVEAGLTNLTDDAARMLVFREDGWTQAWILLRVPESAGASAPAEKQ